MVSDSSSSSDSDDDSSTTTTLPNVDLLQSLWRSRKLSDLTLVASDGVRVEVHRCILAAASSVFDAMLCGSFEESSKSEVKVNFKGNIVSAFVEYIYTNQVTNLFEECKGCRVKGHRLATNLTSCMEAAHFYALEDLVGEMESKASQEMELNSSLAVGILSLCPDDDKGACEALSSLRDEALRVIRSHPSHSILRNAKSLDECSVSSLSAWWLSTLLNDRKLAICEFQRFRLLQAWSEASDDTGNVAAREEGKRTGRKRKAQEMVESIQLEFIDPSDLEATVESSGLVAKQTVNRTFRNQAIYSAKHGSRIWSNPCPQPRSGVWQKSCTAVSNPDTGYEDVLLCRPMTHGIHEWCLNVFADGANFHAWLGVNVVTSRDGASCLVETYCCPTRKRRIGWALMQGCRKADPGDGVDGLRDWTLPRIFSGSKVRFFLDLERTEETAAAAAANKSGRLSVSVNGGVRHLLYDGLLAELDKLRSAADSRPLGFAPAFSVAPKASVRFLGFE